MSDSPEKSEKTEEASPKRLEDAREKGQVAMSNEVVVGFGLLAGLGTVASVGPTLWGDGKNLVRDSLMDLNKPGLTLMDGPALMQGLASGAMRVIPSTLAVIIPVYLLSLMVGYGQIGFRMTPKAVAFDPNKLNPIKGMQKILGPRGWVRTGLAILKITMISIAVWMGFWTQRDGLGGLVGLDLITALTRIVGIIFQAALSGAAMALLIGLLDLIYQRFQHSKDNRMSKKEVKDESKSLDGDPQIKAKIRAVQREMSRNRMMQDVPEATLVVTNPTHFAVALKYDDKNSDRAPYVVAKGMDLVALHIRKVATDAGVPIIEDKPLARGLHRMVDIGDDIPEELFEAVAKVLAFVMNPAATPMTQGASR